MTDKQPEVREGTKYVCDMPPGDGPWTLKQVNGTLYAMAPDQRPHVLTCHGKVGKLGMRWSWEPVDLATP